MACITLTILRFFCPSTFYFVAEGCSFFYKNFVSSGPRGLSNLMGRESVITFKLSANSAAEGVEGASSVSSTFGSAEGVVSSLHFLEDVAFGSGAVFAFFKIFSSSFNSRAACLFRMLTTLFLFTPSALCQAFHSRGIRNLRHPLLGSIFVSAGYRRLQSSTDLLSWYNYQVFHCTWYRSSPAILGKVF